MDHGHQRKRTHSESQKALNSVNNTSTWLEMLNPNQGQAPVCGHVRKFPGKILGKTYHCMQ
jgi:hypothetical protein